MTFSLRVRYWN